MTGLRRKCERISLLAVGNSRIGAVFKQRVGEISFTPRRCLDKGYSPLEVGPIGIGALGKQLLQLLVSTEEHGLYEFVPPFLTHGNGINLGRLIMAGHQPIPFF